MDRLQTPRELVSHIEDYCKRRRFIYEKPIYGVGEYIFRGTSRHFGELTSGLYRKYEKENLFNERFQPVDIEKEIVENARAQFPDATSNKEILTDLRHFGADTTLIDFSHNLFVALFFACNGEMDDEDGCLIALKTGGIDTVGDIEYEPRPTQVRVLDPARTPLSRARVEFQSSVFLHVPDGKVPVSEDITLLEPLYKSFLVPEKLKKELRQYLRVFHNISERTIYNDLFGFIDNQDNFKTAKISFYRGLEAKKSGDHENSIRHYDKAIELRPDYAAAYNSRGVAKAELRNNRDTAKARLRRFKEAIADYDTAIELRPDLADAYYNRGVAKIALNKTDRARSDFKKALDLATEKNIPKVMEAAQKRLSDLDGPG